MDICGIFTRSSDCMTLQMSELYNKATQRTCCRCRSAHNRTACRTCIHSSSAHRLGSEQPPCRRLSPSCKALHDVHHLEGSTCGRSGYRESSAPLKLLINCTLDAV